MQQHRASRANDNKVRNLVENVVNIKTGDERANNVQVSHR